MEKIIFFILILIPNFLRQVSYILSNKKTKSTDFIVSNETRWFFKKKKLYLGFIEEVIFAIAYTYFWFYVPVLRFLAYGWLVDAVADITIAFANSRKIKKPWFLFYNKGTKGKISFFVREFLICYIIIGPVLYLLGINIYQFAYFAILYGIILCLRINLIKQAKNQP